jgi:hypothetical protein
VEGRPTLASVDTVETVSTALVAVEAVAALQEARVETAATA